MARVAAAGLIVALGTIAAYATIGSAGAEPPIDGRSPTVYVTKTVHVRATYHGHSAGYWHLRLKQARADHRADARRNRRVIHRLQRSSASLESTLRDFRDGFGIRAVSPFLCIHGGEGSWTDPGAPYYGGLQMDWSFMQTYGGPFLRAYGTADRWPPFIQLAVAEYARLSGRGYYPWPNTARRCGLL